MTRTVTLSCDHCAKPYLEGRAHMIEVREKLGSGDDMHFCNWKCLLEFGRKRLNDADAQRGRE